ncbi:MAG: hypothetical protein MRK02_07230 [Candidatus Scalindua sp.]|nr:hypothetical protein [Candidatus Scalindua sp.]
MFRSEDFADELIDAGFDFFTGVPCTIIGNLIGNLTNRPDATYIPAVREDVAVGIAAGAYVAGKIPVVLMQNSGIGQCLNALTSLNLIYGLPCLLLVTWRGFKGNDAPEHIIMGKTCDKILDTIGIAYHSISGENAKELINVSYRHVLEKKTPVALFLKKGVLD